MINPAFESLQKNPKIYWSDDIVSIKLGFKSYVHLLKLHKDEVVFSIKGISTLHNNLTQALYILTKDCKYSIPSIGQQTIHGKEEYIGFFKMPLFQQEEKIIHNIIDFLNITKV